ncbi:MAG: ribonuclease III domain-containing protein [bacterium]|nr:ribonuclease III domain-containing protein [bacterium]
MDVREINVLVLAYLGDSIYETYIREFLINKKISNVNELQTKSIKYVSAKSQCEILKLLQDNNFLSIDEEKIIKRGRNNKKSGHPKNCDIITYKHATSFECLIGYLHLTNNDDRINEIINFILEKRNI